MTVKVNESLHSSVNVNLLKKTGSGTELIYSETGRNAGLELVGDVEELTKGLKKPVVSANEHLIVIHLNWIGLKTLGGFRTFDTTLASLYRLSLYRFS